MSFLHGQVEDSLERFDLHSHRKTLYRAQVHYGSLSAGGGWHSLYNLREKEKERLITRKLNTMWFIVHPQPFACTLESQGFIKGQVGVTTSSSNKPLATFT